MLFSKVPFKEKHLKNVKEALLYQKQGLYNLAIEKMEESLPYIRDPFILFQLGELYREKAQREEGELNLFDYKMLIHKAIQMMKKCKRYDKGKYFRFLDKNNRVNYFTLREIAERRIKQLTLLREGLPAKRKEEIIRQNILNWGQVKYIIKNGRE